MCAFSFTVFLSAFQLFPTVPFRIRELGGSTFAAGLFLGFLTYASAFSAPLTGAIGDRVGRVRLLFVCSVLIAMMAVAYGVTTNYRVLLALAFLHGVVWSGLLSGSSAYTTDLIPPARRAEGIGYWGISSVLAIAMAPAIGLWIYRYGWTALCGSIGLLNVAMAAIALSLRPQPIQSHAGRDGSGPTGGGAEAAARRRPFITADMFEWRIAAVAFTLFLYTFGYGGVMSFVALYADANGITPRGLYFAVFSIVIILTRPFTGRLADRIGHTKILLPALALVSVGYALLALAVTRAWLLASAIVFGMGFGSAYPVFAAWVLGHVDPRRRGAAFGGILASFDTGIGTGSIVTGLVVQRYGFSAAYAMAALVASLSIPYFLIAAPRLLRRDEVPSRPRGRG